MAKQEQSDDHSVTQQLRKPHVLAQMMTVAAQLSSRAQLDFLQVIELLATEFRRLVRHAGMLKCIQINHKRLWPEMANVPIAFIDGGVANLRALGAAPVAIRVGSYLVIPGKDGTGREQFRIEKQLVDELYQPARNEEGFYEDLFEDMGKLRDVARISLECAGAIQALEYEPRPQYVILHGTLVNPVSMYALDGFPDFSTQGLRLLLPRSEWSRTGKDANFVPVHLRQLEVLKTSGACVCSVVERESPSNIVARSLLKVLQDQKLIDRQFRAEAQNKLHEYKISDSILFQCILDIGEYIAPIAIDRNDLRRAPDRWKVEIEAFPKPIVTFVKLTNRTLPLRVEAFDNSSDIHDRLMDLIIHSCRLLPEYAFPAGLDIVDKHVKIPNWMSRPINSMAAAQLLRRALDTKNERIISEARRLLAGNSRDWLFRPGYSE